MTQELRAIRAQLQEIAEKEATKLYRLAWRMTAHGCSSESIEACREEANTLHMTGYPERLIDWKYENAWQYAFKF